MNNIANYIKENVENNLEKVTHALIGFIKASDDIIMKTVGDIKEELLELSDDDYSYLKTRAIYESFQNDELLQKKQESRHHKAIFVEC